MALYIIKTQFTHCFNNKNNIFLNLKLILKNKYEFLNSYNPRGNFSFFSSVIAFYNNSN